jgi:hypothetical protein
MAKAKSKKKEEKPEVITQRPKVLLDAEILAALNRHYSARLGDDVLGRECFSDPKLDSHICCVHAKVPGGGVCKSCGNVEGRPCTTTCHVHHFCLAAYATRLGIGVSTKQPNVLRCISHNLKELTYAELYKMVQERRALCEVPEPAKEEAPLKDRVQEELDLPAPEPPAEKKRVPRSAQVFSKEELEAEGLLTIKAAAEIFGCTYMNMMGHVRRGNISRVERSGAIFLRRDDVLALQEKLRKTP